jgi:hypothetical protein
VADASESRGTLDASVEILHDGLACHFLRYSSDPVLAAAQQDARNNGRGFWAAGAQKPACVAENAAFAASRAGAAPAPAAGTSRSPVPRAGASASSPGGASAVRGPFHGNTQSRVYHQPSCPNYSCRNCTVVFESEADARRAGFRPAGDCLGK